jgi:hypothetical protein
MILGFKEHFDVKKQQPTYFREKILGGAGYMWVTMMYPQDREESSVIGESFAMRGNILFTPKLHTIREDKLNRWKVGMSIQMINRMAKYKIKHHFNKGIPELETLKGIQTIEIKYLHRPLSKEFNWPFYVLIDGRQLNLFEVEQLAVNDGFENAVAFLKWFNKDFTGKILHWTDLKY